MSIQARNECILTIIFEEYWLFALKKLIAGFLNDDSYPKLIYKIMTKWQFLIPDHLMINILCDLIKPKLIEGTK